MSAERSYRRPGRPAAPPGPPGRPSPELVLGRPGPIRVFRALPDELVSLERRCEARRGSFKLPQSGRTRDLRDDWAAFLGEFDLDVVFTLTFSDDYARDHYIYSPTSALNDFERFLRDIDNAGDYLACAEPHFDRDVPHLHGLMESKDLPLVNLWREWFRTRGRARFEPPRSDACRYYCTKYALKERDPDVIRFRLTRRTRRDGGRR